MVAEDAKVIENTRRDLSIALVNELTLIFSKMGIDTESMLKTAGSKRSFLPFRPCLVDSHCIGVDPYYLTPKAQAVGYPPEIILAGRRLIDRLGTHVIAQLANTMTKKRIHIDGIKVLVIGFAFKENCPDLRNARVIDILVELKENPCKVYVPDPWISVEKAPHEWSFRRATAPNTGCCDAIGIAVTHNQFKEMGTTAIRSLGKPVGAGVRH